MSYAPTRIFGDHIHLSPTQIFNMVMLPTFLEWLDKNRVIDRKHIQDTNDTGFYTRSRIQKCLYLAQCLGLGTDYKYTQYVYGPYSQELTDDYDDISSDGKELPQDFDQKQREMVLRAHSWGLAWLEVATTIIQNMRDRKMESKECVRDVVEHNVAEIKYQYTDDCIHTVYDDLLETPLRSTVSGAEPTPAVANAPVTHQ